jgi:hypothetical protein
MSYEPDFDEPREEVDLSDLEEGYAQAPLVDPSEPIPDGKYQVQVASVAIATAKSGNRVLRWKLEIVAPARFAGRVLWRNNVLEDVAKYQMQLKRDLHICGITTRGGNDLKQQLPKLLDLRLEVAKRTKGDFDNVYLNQRLALDELGDQAVHPGDDLSW